MDTTKLVLESLISQLESNNFRMEGNISIAKLSKGSAMDLLDKHFTICSLESRVDENKLTISLIRLKIVELNA